MIDVHCHMQFHSFKDDYDEVIKRAFEKGITRIINTGTQVSSSIEAIKFADTYEKCYAIVGVHPHHADKIELQKDVNNVILGSEKRATPESFVESQTSSDSGQARMSRDAWIKELEKLTDHPKVIGIGECGLDYFSYKSNGIVDPKLQKNTFEAQIELSYRARLPLQIHNRHAGEDIVEILMHHKNLLQPVPGMFHCFAGTHEVLKKALDLGFYIGFDGNITYKGLAPGETVSLPELAKATPLDRIVIETDSPFLTPIPHRGKRNEPQYAILVAEFLAQIKNITLENLIEQTDKNVYTIFSKLK